MSKEQAVRRQMDELGRVVIPKDIREQANIKPKDYFNIYCEEKTIKMEREQCQDLLEYVSNKIAKALHDNFLNEIIITNKEKVVSTYGKKVKKYLGLNISNVLKEQLDDEHLSLLRTSNLQITDDDVIDSTYYYFAIKDNYYNIGGVFILGNKKNAFSEELLNFINAIISN